MEGVDHVDVIKVCGCGFVCQIYGVFERDIPDGEGFELCIACGGAALMLMIELAQAGCHLATAGTRCGYDNKAALGLYVIVLAEAILGYYKLHV